MRPRDIALAVAVAAVWGFNFVVIRVGLDQMPPLLFSALRFGLAAVPAVLFIGRPQVPWRWVFAVGFSLGVISLSLLPVGMAAGMPAGLSSLVLQSQALFTMVFAIGLLRERPGARQWAGLTVALSGIVLVAVRLGTDRPVEAFVLVLGSAAAWGLSNIATRKAAPPDVLRFMVWVSAVSFPPLLVLSLIFEGPTEVGAALAGLDLTGLGALAYIAGISTLGGFAAWGRLIRRNGASVVAPFSMLVPFFGMSSAALTLGERIHFTDILAGVLVVGGLLLGAVQITRRGRSQPSSQTAVMAPVRVGSRA